MSPLGTQCCSMFVEREQWVEHWLLHGLNSLKTEGKKNIAIWHLKELIQLWKMWLVYEPLLNDCSKYTRRIVEILWDQSNTNYMRVCASTLVHHPSGKQKMKRKESLSARCGGIWPLGEYSYLWWAFFCSGLTEKQHANLYSENFGILCNQEKHEYGSEMSKLLIFSLDPWISDHLAVMTDE
jgi:hypothetical protein